jgi:hypothetical protein
LLFSVESEVGTAGLQPVAISSIAGSGRLVSSRSWAAQATVTIKAHDGFNFGAGVSGATVTGTFSPGGNSSCVTGSTGSCTLTSSNIRRTYTSTTFTANAISGSGLVYDSTKNASTRTTISRP